MVTIDFNPHFACYNAVGNCTDRIFEREKFFTIFLPEHAKFKIGHDVIIFIPAQHYIRSEKDARLQGQSNNFHKKHPYKPKLQFIIFVLLRQ